MKALLTMFTLVLGFWASFASASPNLIPAPPQLSSNSYLLMDALTGEIIVEHNAHQEVEPASLTKLMTAYIVEYELARGNLAFEDMVTVSEKAWRMGGSRMFIREGTRVSIEDLLRGIVIQSGNDASIAAAEYIAGSESAFADLMNQHARLLGMNNSNFVNASGFPAENHYSTAYDMAVISRATILQFPENYTMYAEKEFTYNDITQPNRNRLLWRDNTVDGLKTGHTQAAGYCLAASAERNGTRFIAVVMGARSDEIRMAEAQRLLDFGFRFYETRKMYSRGQVVNDARVWGGSKSNVKVGFIEDVMVTIPRQQGQSLPATLEMKKQIMAPIAIGDVLGTITVGTQGNILLERQVVALEVVEAGGFFKRTFDRIKLFFMKLF